MSDPQRYDSRGYPMPKDGWTCFHCGENFTTWGSARDHFGTTPDKTAACVIKLGDERGLVMELRKAEEMADQQMERALQAERETETAQCRISSLSDAMHSFKPFKKCDSINEIFFLYDSMEGRALASEEREQQLVNLINNEGYTVMIEDSGRWFLRKELRLPPQPPAEK